MWLIIFAVVIKRLKEQIATPKLAGKTINALAHIHPEKAGALAFQMFCTPREGRLLNAKEQRFLDQAEQIELRLGEIPIKTYVWKGGESKVLLAHGYESNSARWRALVPFLVRNGYTVIAIDAPAHGQSGSDTVNGVMYAQSLELAIHHFSPQYAIGHSFGGMSLAYYFSTFEYQSISKLILMATPSRLRIVIDLFYETLDLTSKSRMSMEDYFTNKFGFTIDFFTVGDFIKDCKIPGLIIHDAIDTVAPIQEAHHIKKSWEVSDLLITNGLGHFLQSGQVYKSILDTLK